MTYYAVFDTNVLVSSLLTKNEDAATAKVIYEIASKRIIPIYSKEIFEEYNEVLHRDKFPFTDEKDVVFYEVVMDKRDDCFKQTLGSAFLFIVFTYTGC